MKAHGCVIQPGLELEVRGSEGASAPIKAPCGIGHCSMSYVIGSDLSPLLQLNPLPPAVRFSFSFRKSNQED